MSAEIIEVFGAHNNMTPEEALAVASREEWIDIVIIGFRPDDPAIHIRSSHISRATALWMYERAKLHALGLYDLYDSDGQ